VPDDGDNGNNWLIMMMEMEMESKRDDGLMIMMDSFYSYIINKK
jgi:hypothetical protein